MNIKRFAGFILILVGGLIALLAGGCTLIFEGMAASSGTRSGSMDEIMFPLMVGGIPTVIGIGMLILGLHLNK